ncbi:melanoma-associated antigen 10-like [Lepus europaeus]|uniref:melanoma-associated antigen 10-like n=1 Tax=Lepus europaeus TaxID=9983 RepID=UPI002B49ADED|nr:melanoma-associated antigen 10-like [Lepus europaeus]
MPRFAKCPRLTLEQEFQDSDGTQQLSAEEVSTAEEEKENISTGFSGLSSCSLPLTLSASSSSPVIPSTPETDDKPAAGLLNLSHCPQTFYSSSISCTISEQPRSLAEESSSTLQASQDTDFLPKDSVEEKVTKLMNFLILKYRLKEAVTKAEMLEFVIEEYQDQFPGIFERASKCLEVIFGIDIREVDPPSDFYVLVNSLGLTSCEMLSDDFNMPKTSLLIVILGVIFIEGNCASEDSIWEFLSMLGVYPGREHFIYGEPWKLITNDWVQENYLEYRQVPDSDPPKYEFLWGPRAYVETSKMKVLEFLAKVNESDLISFTYWYDEALRDEQERSQDKEGPVDSNTACSLLSNDKQFVLSQVNSEADPSPSLWREWLEESCQVSK